MSTWKGVAGRLHVEVQRELCPYCPDWHVSTCGENQKVLPEALGSLMDADAEELTVYFESAGYYDAGNRWDVAPEGDEERTLYAVELTKAVPNVCLMTGELIDFSLEPEQLPNDLAEQVFDALSGEIYAVDIDRTEYHPDPPDWPDEPPY